MHIYVLAEHTCKGRIEYCMPKVVAVWTQCRNVNIKTTEGQHNTQNGPEQVQSVHVVYHTCRVYM